MLTTLLVLYLGGSFLAAERPAYTLERRIGPLEIRHYSPYLVVQTEVDAPLERAGNEGFQRLAGYIFGGNVAGTRIAMTAPVTVAPLETRLTPQDPGFLVQFMMPAAFTLAALPAPKDPRVVFQRIPARQMAALAYRGNWSEGRYRTHLGKLQAALAAEGLKAVGLPAWARYDPPWMPTFMRTNEVLVEVVTP
jgi:hypothetical protein